MGYAVGHVGRVHGRHVRHVGHDWGRDRINSDKGCADTC